MPMYSVAILCYLKLKLKWVDQTARRGEEAHIP